MRISIPNLFGRPPMSEPAGAPPPDASPPAGDVGPATPRSVGESTADFGVPVTYMSSGIPDVDSAFGYGHLDGNRGVEPENFREYIGHTVEGEAIDRLLGELEMRERDAREKAASLRSQRADIAARGRELEALRGRGERNARELEAALQEQCTAHEQHWHAGSVSQAVIFLVAGMLFILGDVVMSQKVVADALALTGTKFFGVIDESWVFALGLAMVSVVLKPAFDRLVEKPYWQGKETRFVITIGVLALLSGVTLWVLGAFRFESHGLQQQIALVMANPSLSAAQKAQALVPLQEAMDSSQLARWSFILSGILFAAAGAASLGIGLRYWRYHRHVRKPAARRLKEQRAERERARSARAALVQELGAREAELERMAALLADEPPAAVLDERAAALAAERRELLRTLVDERKLRLTSLYDDGYELGRVNARAQENTARAERPRRKRARPFVALRRMIREQAVNPAALN